LGRIRGRRRYFLKLIKIRECKTTKLIDEQFNPQILPKGYSKYFMLKIDEDNDLCIETEANIGIIPCKNNIAIQIYPKIKVSDLTYLLIKSGLLNRSLDTPFKQTVPYQIAENSLDSFFEALVNNFLFEIDKIKCLGLLRTTEINLKELKIIKGKPDLSRFRIKYPKNLGLNLDCWLIERNFNNSLNRVLYFCLNHLMKSYLITIDQKNIVKRMEYFSVIKMGPMLKDDLIFVNNALENRDIPSSRYYYVPALNLALLILQGVGITLGEEQDVEFRPLIINTNIMFENYVCKIIKENFKNTRISVLRGIEYSYFFYDEARDRLTLIPDIVLVRGGENLAIIDVKYKVSPTPSDHYQMWAYMQAYDINRGLFVSVTNLKENIIEQFKKDSRIVYDYSFSLENIQKSEKDFIYFLRDVFIQI